MPAPDLSCVNSVRLLSRGPGEFGGFGGPPGFQPGNGTRPNGTIPSGSIPNRTTPSGSFPNGSLLPGGTVRTT